MCFGSRIKRIDGEMGNTNFEYMYEGNKIMSMKYTE